jgi:hypothetical protein
MSAAQLACANAPQVTPQSRADRVVSRNTKPLPTEKDEIPYAVRNYSESLA